MHTDTHPEPPRERVEVAVITTSGRWPTEPDKFETEVPPQPVSHVLGRAIHALKIKDDTGWLATVNDREIDPKKSYRDNGLSGRIEIQYGPRAGGGGRA
jgi:hypothetical protein